MFDDDDEIFLKLNEDNVSEIMKTITKIVNDKGWNSVKHRLEVYAALKMMSDQMGEEMGVIELNQEPDEKPHRLH